jgi:hypothetical protein
LFPKATILKVHDHNINCDILYKFCFFRKAKLLIIVNKKNKETISKLKDIKSTFIEKGPTYDNSGIVKNNNNPMYDINLFLVHIKIII